MIQASPLAPKSTLFGTAAMAKPDASTVSPELGVSSRPSMISDREVTTTSAPGATSARTKGNTSNDSEMLKSKITMANYISLGVIQFQNVHSSSHTAEWTELKEEPLPFPYEQHEVFGGISRLFQLAWIRIFVKRNSKDPRYTTARIFLLPDDVARSMLPRSDKKARTALRALMVRIDRSEDSWSGDALPTEDWPTYAPVIGEDDSLFYIFNTLPSPMVSPGDIEDEYASEAVGDVLSNSLHSRGMMTTLYPYQRRTAAAMIARETAPNSNLDPRLEELLSPSGDNFYFDRFAGHVLKDKKTFEEARGGILAETMGYGKTLISLAVILATKNTIPMIPPEHTLHIKNQSSGHGCRSLAEMAAAAMSRHNVPWKQIFAEYRSNGHYYECSEKVLKATIGSYQIYTEINNRRESTTLVDNVHLLSTTLVVVPSNLLLQWKSEVTKHIRDDAISIFVAEDRVSELPDAAHLGDYDMILMTRTRFEEETSRSTRNLSETDQRCRCHVARRLCHEHDYRSPLRDAHFLRLIVDEGQGFISGSLTHALYGLQMLRVDRKWIMSGTPTSGMIGAEVDLAAEEDHESPPSVLDFAPQAHVTEKASSSSLCPSPNGLSMSSVQKTLLNRRKVVGFAEEKKSIERLGLILKKFLGVRPWANVIADGDIADWKTHVVPASSGGRKPLSLRNVLQQVVIRHRIEHIESDLQLPPLHNHVVRLQPAFADKLSINLFILTLATNAITSERTDQDYMFHPMNRKPLEQLIKNMRSSAFFWSGFTEHDVFATCQRGEKFLEEHSIDPDDRKLLEDGIAIGRAALASPSWNAYSKSGELGLYVSELPRETDPSWTLCPQTDHDLSLLGTTQLLTATQLAEKNVYASDPLKFLTIELPATNGAKPSMSTSTPKKASPKKGGHRDGAVELAKGISMSSLQDPLKIMSGKHPLRNMGSSASSAVKSIKRRASDAAAVSKDEAPASILKASSQLKPPIPQAYQHLADAKLVGTSSAKLSYLLDRIVALHKDEKILVFYEGDHIAYYCAQALEILGIPHFIYSVGLSLKLRIEYQTVFNGDCAERVMLMDLKQAALGLHIASASRVFFVNPIWQPNIEAQAIKRAHRIGQTRPVYVETLILQNTIEEQMLERRKSMTKQEQDKAAKSLLDDIAMTDMIKNMRIIQLSEREKEIEDKQYAPLAPSQQVFARSVAETHTIDELNNFITSQQMDGDRIGPAEHTIAYRTTLNPPDLPLHSDGAAHPKKKRKLVFADEQRENTGTSTANFPTYDPSTISQHGRSHVNGVGVPQSSRDTTSHTDGGLASAPLSALNPRRTIRFADTTIDGTSES